MRHLLRALLPLRGLPLALLIIASMFLSSFIVNSISYSTLKKLKPLYKTMKWEKEGRIYQKLFNVKFWKDYVPSVSVFDKKNLSRDLSKEYIEQYILESLRAELCHDLIIIFAIIFIIITPDEVNLKIILWTFASNIPCIIIQRYNRPRFEAIRKRDEIRNQGRR